MPIDILLTVIATAAIQSLFGVGVLLFGTPILLLLDYGFTDTLSILLPISIAINCLQIIKHYQFIDTFFYKRVLTYSIPLVVLFLFFASTISININLIVGAFLILVALKNVFPRAEQSLEKMIKYERSYLSIMGLIHGLTNLGGSLLTAIVHGKQYEKNATRSTIAMCYATFAIFQLLTLFLLETTSAFSYADHASFLQIGMLIFLFTEEVFYTTINNKKYSQFFALFLLISGVLLIFK